MTMVNDLPQRGIFRIIMGLTAASIVPVFSAVLLIPLFLRLANYGCEANDCLGIDVSFDLGIWSGIYAGPIALLHVITLGLPAVIIGLKTNRIQQWTCIIVGFLIGCIPTGIYFLSQTPINTQTLFSINNGKSIAIALIIPIFAGIFGAISGFSFWIVWKFLTPKQQTTLRKVFPETNQIS